MHCTSLLLKFDQNAFQVSLFKRSNASALICLGLLPVCYHSGLRDRRMALLINGMIFRRSGWNKRFSIALSFIFPFAFQMTRGNGKQNSSMLTVP